ncbi:transcriptional regulator, partial [Paenarthrobacter ureafaciens]
PVASADVRDVAFDPVKGGYDAQSVDVDPLSRDFFVDWDTLADDFAAALPTTSGQNPRDRALNSLIGDLAAGSTEFSTRWARHNVRFHRSARKTMRNQLVGEIELTGDALELPGEGLTLVAYSAEPGSHAQDQLDFLASWSSSKDRLGPAPVYPPTA